jgi:hypothetical protein
MANRARLFETPYGPLSVVASSVCTMLWKHGAIMLPHSPGNCDTAQQHLVAM